MNIEELLKELSENDEAPLIWVNKKVFDMKDEIERLNNELENVKMHYETEAEAKYYEFIDNHESKLQQRIDKAIEYIEENCTEHGEGKWAYRTINADNTLNILKGVDKE